MGLQKYDLKRRDSYPTSFGDVVMLADSASFLTSVQMVHCKLFRSLIYSTLFCSLISDIMTTLAELGYLPLVALAGFP